MYKVSLSFLRQRTLRSGDRDAERDEKQRRAHRLRVSCSRDVKRL